MRTFESLGDRNFRWFFISTLGQFGGIQTQMLAMGFIVYELTGSPGRLGLVALVNAIPSLAFSLYGGMLADRLPGRLVLQVGQGFQALLAALVAVLLFMDLLRYEHLIAIVFFQGAGMALMMPARQAMIPEIAGEERLMNAISLSAAGMTTMRLIAPAIGGALLVIASRRLALRRGHALLRRRHRRACADAPRDRPWRGRRARGRRPGLA